MGTPVHVWYHGNCWDGFGSAWAVHRKFSGTKLELRFQELNHGAPLPAVTRGERVWFLDFCPSREDLRTLLRVCSQVLIIDHHKTAIDWLGNFAHQKLYKELSLEKSGAVLTWEYFHGRISVPLLLRYVQDRDLWAWSLHKSREFSANLRSYPRTFEAWNQIHYRLEESERLEGLEKVVYRDTFLLQGEAILRDQKRFVDERIRHARHLQLGEHDALAVNATDLFSEVAGQLAERSPSGIGVTYFIRSDGKWQFSLRSIEGGPDVAELAKRFGGGGHVRAAGFELGPLPFTLDGWLREGTAAATTVEARDS